MAGCAGFIFGLGLIVSGMANPANVIAFLDVWGAWNPSLGWVMAGAISVAMVGFGLAKRKKMAYLGPVQWPKATQLEWRLVLGSLLFGIGWGLASICPGPALVALGSGVFKAAVFVAAMLVGMGLHGYLIGKNTPTK